MKKHTLITGFLRLTLAFVFIFSGFVKAADPWGTSIKLGEYFQAFSLGGLSGLSDALSVLLSTAETTLGLCLLFRIRERAVTLCVTVVLAFFTLLTFILALWNPVSDCGCFGDAVKLTNWQTFYKNIVLLAFALLLGRLLPSEPRRHDRHRTMVESSMIFFFILFSAGVGIYSLRHLPVIDFLPFRTGVNIPSQMAGSAGDVTTTVVYRDRQTGTEREFALSDTTWYDTLRWEYVDTRIVEQPTDREPTILDFAVFDADGDHTSRLLASSREVFLVTLTSTEDELSPRCRERLAGAVRYALRGGYHVVCATTSPLPEDGRIDLGGERIPLYNIDGTTLKTLIRARAGLVLLREGTILGKWNCRDIPHFEPDYAGRTAAEVVAERGAQSETQWLLGVLAASMTLIYIAYTAYRRQK